MNTFIVFIIALASTNCFATAMSPKLSKCFGVQKVAREHKEWKSEFSRFLVDDELTREQKLEPLRRSLSTLTDRLEIIKNQGEVRVNQNLIDQPRAFLRQFNAGHIGKDVAYRMMTTGLRNLEDEIDGALLKVHMKTEACDILEENRSSGRSNSNSSGAVR